MKIRHQITKQTQIQYSQSLFFIASINNKHFNVRVYLHCKLHKLLAQHRSSLPLAQQKHFDAKCKLVLAARTHNSHYCQIKITFCSWPYMARKGDQR